MSNDILEPLRRFTWRMAAGEDNAVDRVLRPLARVLWRIGYRFEFVGFGGLRGRIADTDAYRPNFSPWTQDRWRADLRVGDGRSLVTPERRYLLVQLLRQAIRNANGSVAECGVYRGGTAYLIAETLQKEAPSRMLRLFDTFAGMPETDPNRDLHRAGDFSDTGLADVTGYLAPFSNTEFYPGLIPASFADVPADRYAFVHIDLDIYDAIRDASEYFYQRLAPGGIMIYDDYALRSCPGARAAVDAFFLDKPEVVIVLSSGQCFVTKMPAALAN